MNVSCRRLILTGERSCLWCRNPIWGDHGELLHVLCAPNVDQVDLFRADVQRLRWLGWAGAWLTTLQAVVAGVGYSEGGISWLDVVWMVHFVGATALVRWANEERVRVTKGMWRKSRHQMAEAQKTLGAGNGRS